MMGLGALAVLSAGCSKIHVTRTLNADGTAIDEYRCLIGEGGVGDLGLAMPPEAIQRELSQVMERAGLEKTVLVASPLTYQGEFKYTALVDQATRAGVLYESDRWLETHKPVWAKQADGGWSYELAVDVQSLERMLKLIGLIEGRPGEKEEAPPGAAQEEPEADAPPPLFPGLMMLPGAGGQKAVAKMDERLEKAWKSLELQVDLVMPGNIKSANTKSFKDRTATWTVKPWELIKEMEAQKPDKDGKTKPVFVLKATCGPPLPAAKADEERFKKLKGQ